MFSTKEYNSVGVYVVNVYVNGSLMEIVVDDFIPVDTRTNKPLFAQKESANIWPIILEKAWAKVNGSYEDIISGESSEATNFLTPYPSEKLFLNNEELIPSWDKAKKALHYNFLVSTSTRDENGGFTSEVENRFGIPSDHAFSVVDMHEITHNGEQLKLLKLRNPWMTQNWKGRW